jgi:hypothetical protein
MIKTIIIKKVITRTIIIKKAITRHTTAWSTIYFGRYRPTIENHVNKDKPII